MQAPLAAKKIFFIERRQLLFQLHCAVIFQFVTFIYTYMYQVFNYLYNDWRSLPVSDCSDRFRSERASVCNHFASNENPESQFY